MLSADRTHAPVVIRALGGLLTILPRAVNRAVRLICACHLFILRLVTLLCGTTYTTPQAATAVTSSTQFQYEIVGAGVGAIVGFDFFFGLGPGRPKAASIFVAICSAVIAVALASVSLIDLIVCNAMNSS